MHSGNPSATGVGSPSPEDRAVAEPFFAAFERDRLARSPARLTTVLCACPSDDASALAAALSASLARQSGRAVLLVDARRDGILVLSKLAASAGAPALGDVLRDRALLALHESTAASDGLLGRARLAGFAGNEGVRPATPDALAALDWLRYLYDDIVLLHSPSDDFGAAARLAAERSFTLVRDTEHAGASPAEGIEIVVLGSGPVTSENGVGGIWDRGQAPPASRGVHVLPADNGALQRILETGRPAIQSEPERAFGRAVDSLARRIGRMQIGVALGAGMAKGFAHLGALRVLRDAGVPIDYIAGTSIGAIVGSAYAGGMPLERLEELMNGADRRLRTLAIPTKALLRDTGLKKIILGCHERAPTARFEDLTLPFAAVATDINSGRKTVLDEGLVWQAVQASVSYPGLFPATVIGNQVFVDGGLVEPVPSQTARDMGADVVIAIDLTSPGRRNGLGGSAEKAQTPGLFRVVWRSMEIMLGEITARSLGAADVVIRPAIGRSGLKDFRTRGPVFIEAGAKAAEAALPQIRALVPASSASRVAV